MNPTQFNQAEDFEKYPRSLAADLAVCAEAGVDWLFAPSAEEVYPQPGLAFVEVEKLTEGLCGATRPGHFRGVTTVCAKLFHIVEPDRVYFGEKDYQQLAVIRRMVRDLDFPLEVVGVETVREPDGLALSSRNQRLSARERRAAVCVYRGLGAAQRLHAGGESQAAELVNAARAVINSEPLSRPEYIAVVDAATLEPLVTVDRPARIAAAVRFGGVRLIDNLPLG